MIIVFDFDGVLCEYVGWRGHDKIGKPIKSMIDLVEGLYMLGHVLKLSTTRLNPFPKGDMWEDKLVSSGEAKEYIMDWLQEQGILKYFKEITGYKPFGDVYIDDRALRFDDFDWRTDEDKKQLVELQDKLFEAFSEHRLEEVSE